MTFSFLSFVTFQHFFIWYLVTYQLADPVRHIVIIKQPNKAQYDKNTPTINLTCKGDGNPKPNYKWFRQDDTRSILSWTDIYIIEYVIQNNSGVYICEAYNTIDDIEYNANYSMKIDISELVIFRSFIIMLKCFSGLPSLWIPKAIYI